MWECLKKNVYLLVLLTSMHFFMFLSLITRINTNTN